MNNLLQSYLVEFGHLSLAGMGRLETVLVPARYNVAEHRLDPPSGRVNWQPLTGEETDSLQHLTGFLARALQVTEEEAFDQYRAHCAQMQQKIRNAGELVWPPFGRFLLSANELQFEQADSQPAFAPLSAERIIHEGVAHQLRVGDNETTTTEMEAFLNNTEEEKERWWLLPLLIALAAIALICWKRWGM
ncbi:MAG: hypothetical protein MUF29_11095 [Chitinophagaceae bacterium]|nr:hypothetical protein [Chitinophagaceae bacterium]